jgi:hypothetical protein
MTEVRTLSGTVNLAGRERDETLGPRRTCRPLCHPGNASDLGPGLQGNGTCGSVLIGWEVIAAEMKEVVDPIMGGEKTLRLAG